MHSRTGLRTAAKRSSCAARLALSMRSSARPISLPFRRTHPARYPFHPKLSMVLRSIAYDLGGRYPGRCLSRMQRFARSRASTRKSIIEQK